jgi:4-hydroxy-tetrahydrodipicolinate synthase
MFDRDNNLDENATVLHWDWLIGQGVDGLVIAGTSGEFIALENHERLRLFRLAHEICARRVPLIFGTGHYSTRLTIEMSVEAERIGADAVIVILPYYQRPPKSAVIRHFREIRRAVDLPIMLYNNPANSACVDFTPQEIVRLVDEDVVQMVKSTYETVVPIHDLAYLAGDRMAIFYGSFQAAFEAMTAGAHGWISGVLNVAPSAARQMFDAVARNDVKHAFEIWKRILPLIHLYTHHQIGPVSDLAIYRSILDLWGLKGGYSRNPFYPLSEEEQSRLHDRLKQANWLEPVPICVSPL